MKTPLSFLAKLMARGRAAEKQLPSSRPAAVLEAPKIDEAAVAMPSPAAITAAQINEVASAEPIALAEEERLADDAGSAITIAPASEVAAFQPAAEERPSADAAATENADDQVIASSAPAVSRIEQAPKRKKVRLEADATPALGIAVSAAEQKLPAMSKEETLDAEIAALRRQLAHKLRLQNNQLREKLARFDRT